MPNNSEHPAEPGTAAISRVGVTVVAHIVIKTLPRCGLCLRPAEEF